jgi:TonB family protein
MKQLIALLICVLFLTAPAVRSQTPQTQSAPAWNLYTVKGERFSIALPVLPMLTTNNEIRKRPQPDRQIRVIRCTSKGVVYVITIVENPKPRVSLEKFIKEQAAASPTEKLTSERDVNLDGIAGKEFDYPDGKGLVRFFAKDDRLYDVRAYGASVDDPKIKTFFHYLSLKKEKDAIEVSEDVQARALDANTESIFIGKEVDTRIRLLKKPEPNYTQTAKGEQIRGTVILKCVFAADGTVTNIRVVQGLPNGLTEKAIEAARKIKFIPATKDGKNVSMWMQLEYNFNLY